MMLQRNVSRIPIIGLLGMALSACSLTPDYHRPTMDIPDAYKEAEAWQDETAGTWKPAEPSDGQPVRWEMLQDPDLLALQARALATNQTIATAMARLGQARALVEEARSARLPEAGVGAGVTRQRIASTAQGEPEGTLQTAWRAQLSIAYEADLFGRVSSSIAAARADAESQAARVNALNLVVQADVANHYFLLRQLDAEAALMDEAAQSWQQTLDLVRGRHAEGLVTDAAVASAEAQLARTQSARILIRRQRALAEHALAVLLGQSPSRFSLDVRQRPFAAIAVPPGLPSSLLERRPDIAAAERAMAAENARIGMARAAFFPSLTLSAAGGYESSSLGSLFDWSQRTFLLGPLVGTALNLPLFDGGRRQAALAQAEAAYQERVAQYRDVVLRAFQDVEDALATLRSLDEQLERLRVAESSAARAQTEALARFQAGDAAYLFVLETERTLLAQKRAVMRTQGDRMRATVDLIRALGGGWHAPESVAAHEGGTS